MKNKFHAWILEGFRNSTPVPIDVLSYLSQEWGKLKPSGKKEAKADLQEWVRKELMYQYWGRCEYEMLILPWPPRDNDEPKKIDVYGQCLPNLELITRLFSENERIN